MVTIRVPPSKSETHRALLLAACADGPSILENQLLSDDIFSTLRVLNQLGVASSATDGGGIRVAPRPWQLPGAPLDCGNSGTTLRLLLAQCARMTWAVTLTGDASLRRRPNGPLLDALRSLGATIAASGGRAPLRVTGPIHSGEVFIDGGVSSQFVSSLLLALAQVPGASRLTVRRPLVSAPYVTVTERVAGAFGLSWKTTETQDRVVYEIPGSQRPAPTRFVIDGDWSSAAFPLVGAALRGRAVRLSGLSADSEQGDRVIVDHLRCFGLTCEWHDSDLQMAAGVPSAAGAIDVRAAPDLFPALCILAACCNGETVVDGAHHLRHKESDRIAAVASGLRALGVACDELSGGLRIVGTSRLGGGDVETRGDHRIVMAFSLLGGVTDGSVCVSHPEAAEVSYPGFHSMLSRLR